MADVLGLASGEALGRSLFRLGKELHRSGSGAVFEAIVLRTGLPVAIKRKDTSELGGRKLIEHEALLLETLSHPNVAVCFGSFVEAGSLYMVLEIADRGDLGQLIQIRHRARQHLSEQEIWGLFTQVCAGIAYMHSKKIIHRDLKPKTCCCTLPRRRDRAVGTDFGSWPKSPTWASAGSSEPRLRWPIHSTALHCTSARSCAGMRRTTPRPTCGVWV